MKYFFALLLALYATSVFAEQNIVIIFDDSGSMNERLRANRITRMEAAKEALSKAVKALPNDTNLGLVTLNGRWEPENWQIPLNPLNKEKALVAIENIFPTGGTRLASAIKVGADELLKFREKNRYGIYKLVVVTDGLADSGHEANSLESHVVDVLSRGLTIDAIGVDMVQTHTLATRVNSYQNANDPQSLATAIAATLAETQVDDNSISEDFQIIASIPDEMAVKLLEAVQKSDNHPIGEPKPIIKINEQGQVITVPQEAESGFNWGLWVLLPLVAALGLFLGIVVFGR